jgi:hypothetical protein
MSILTRRIGETIMAAAILMLSLTISATAQAPLSAQPTETDLHAAYCTQALTIIINFGESLLADFSGPEYSTVPGPNDPPDLRESKAKSAAANQDARSVIESQKAMLRKIDLYLTPRLFDLNPLGLVTAKRAAQEDWDRIQSIPSKCENECPLKPNPAIEDLTNRQKCYDTCSARTMPDLPAIEKKVQSCQNLDWLPF